MVDVVKKKAKKSLYPRKREVSKKRLTQRPDRQPIAILTGDDWKQGITPKQALFVEQYLLDLSASKAAIRAGYSAKTPENAAATGAALLNTISVANAIDAALAKGANITRPRIVEELARIAFSNADDYYEWSTNSVKIKDSNKLTREQKAAVCEVKQTITKDGGTISLRLYDKMVALDKLARITRLLKTETLEVTGANGAPLVPEGATTRDVAEAVLGVLNATRPRPEAFMGDLKAIEDKHDTTE